MVALAVILGMGIWIGSSLLDIWRLDQARKLLAENQAETAWKYLAPLGPTRTTSGEVAFLAAQAARRLKQTTMAKACLDNARKNGWPTEAIDLEQALLDLHSGQPGPQMEQLMDSLQGEYPERPRVLEALIPALFRQFDLDRALFCATLWTQLEPQNPKAWVWLGRVQEKLQNRPPAEAAFQKAIAMAPEDTEALAWMARQLQRRRQPAEALELLGRLKELDPAREDLPLIEGKCLQDLGREEEARTSLREAVKRQPQGGEGWVELGRLELNTNHPDVAEEAFRRALRVSPSDREALFSLAQALERQGKKAEAETVRGRQLQVETDLKATRDAAEKIRENPKDPAPRVEIAGLMLQNGLTQEGRRWLDSALNLDPKHVKGRELARKYGLR
jgi:tetratricopeptide (TPR) repeat protein